MKKPARPASLSPRIPGGGFLALVLVSLVAGCGSSSNNSNQGKIGEARNAEARVEQIRQTLTKALQLHPYAGVEYTFTVPPGRPDVHLGESGKQCSIDNIEVGKDTVRAYSADPNVLISPDKTAIVTVGTFIGTPRSDCLEEVRKALNW